MSPVRPMTRRTPALKGSVLLCLRCTMRVCGSVLELVAMSDASRPPSGCEARWVNSPALKNPKNPRQHAAHSIILSVVLGSWDHTLCNIRRMSGVIGSHLGRECPGIFLRIPFNTNASLGNDARAGSGRPVLIWTYLVALRYE